MICLPRLAYIRGQMCIRDRNSTNYNTRSFGERVAMNAPIQGTAADIIKLAMVKVHRALQGEQARLILQVHDELIVETPEADAAQVRAMMRAEMESCLLYTSKV